MTSPTSGATPSHTPKMSDVLTDVRQLGLWPPRTIAIRKLSRLSVMPSVRSAITRVPRDLASEAGGPALQVGSYPLLCRGQGPEPNAGRNRRATGAVCPPPPPVCVIRVALDRPAG